MRRLALLSLLLLPLAAASAPLQSQATPLDALLRQALAEQRGAQAEADRLQRAAEQARGTAQRLQAQQAAAGEALAAAEAGITAADARLRVASAAVAAHRAQLLVAQRPAASLLAGLALMARQPPLLVLADRGSAEELVRVRVLIAATVPAIRARTAQLAGQLEQGRRLASATQLARAQLLASRRELAERRTAFAQLEREALASAAAAGSESLSAGDVALAAGEDISRLQSEQPGSRAAYAIAGALAAEAPAPPRPVAGEDRAGAESLAYALPTAAPVSAGLGAVNASGVRSRGLSLLTGRGAVLLAPAAGTIRYAGPFRDYDGVIIVDHGRGWLTLIVNAAAALPRGARVTAGQPLGRALGPIQLELSHNGRPVSPALIAGSSARMSNGGKGG